MILIGYIVRWVGMTELYEIPITVEAIEKLAFNQIKAICVKRRGLI